jgi:hypothetical protein
MHRRLRCGTCGRRHSGSLADPLREAVEDDGVGYLEDAVDRCWISSSWRRRLPVFRENCGVVAGLEDNRGCTMNGVLICRTV